MSMFKHFETRAKAKAFIATQPSHPALTIRKKNGTHAKSFAVATSLTHLHFTPDSWVKKRKRK